jgi:hypothetical protein
MKLRDILFIARSQLRDLGVKTFTDAELIAYANISKCDIVSMMREAREDFFLATTTSTVATTTTPNPSTVTLPSDFLELKELMCVNTGYEDICFLARDMTSPQFRRALIDGGSFGNGTGLVFYDIYGNSTLMFSPGFDMALNIKIDYIKDVADMFLPTDECTDIPDTLHHAIPTGIVCQALRGTGDPRLAQFELFRKEQMDEARITIQPRQIREPKFATGFMEWDEW